MEVELSQQLHQKGLWIVTAESCTGGSIAGRITRIAGSSHVFWGGFVAYDNSAKVALLDVPAELITRHGAVSAEVAQAMATGALARMPEPFRSKGLALATTGIAGPGGGTAEKPIGLCYLGLAVVGRTQARAIQSPSGLERVENQRFFADQALAWAIATVRTSKIV